MPYRLTVGSSGHGNTLSSRPVCAVVFFRFPYRDTLNENVLIQGADKIGFPGIIHDEDHGTLTTEPIEASRDVMDCTVTKSKDRPAGTWNVTLSPGNVNYHAALHPGDHVLIFMKRDRQGLTKALTNPTGEGFDQASGLKMWGTITSVRVVRSTDPGTGFKSVRYLVSGEDFGHFFETDLYFHPKIAEALSGAGTDPTQRIILNRAFGWVLDLSWGSPSKNVNDLVNAFIGDQINVGALPSQFATPNQNFVIPGIINNYFGGSFLKSGARLTSVLQRQIGVLHYHDSSGVPSIGASLSGRSFIQFDMSGAHSIWSVLQNWSNPLVNEMFLDLRPNDNGKLVPTLVVRQFPWTSSAASRKLKLTNTPFVSLPRLVIPEALIYSEDLGRNEQGRTNYIQLWGTQTLLDGAHDWQNQQVAHGNFAIDIQSIRRYGVHTMIRTSNADMDQRNLNGQVAQEPPSQTENFTLVKDWTELYADWFLRNHVFETGTFQTIGIEEPLSLGDNIEVVRDSGAQELYHVQSYSHSFGVGPGDGKLQFRTTISVTRGQLVSEDPIYSETNSIGDSDVTLPGVTSTNRNEAVLNKPVVNPK